MVLDNHYGMVMDPWILRLGEIANGIKIKITTVTPTPKESDFTMQESAGAAAPYTKLIENECLATNLFNTIQQLNADKARFC